MANQSSFQTDPQLAAHKFGGSSLANADCFRRVIAILQQSATPKGLVVVSAMRGVTNQLIKLAELAGNDDDAWQGGLDEIRQKHIHAAHDLLGDNAAATVSALTHSINRLEEILKAMATLCAPSNETMELVEGWGETLSARILCDALKHNGINSGYLDAREVLEVAAGKTGVIVDWQQSQKRYDQWTLDNPAPWNVITGFIARTAQGRPTLLGRNGSDYSAAIFSVLAKAHNLTIWGDTHGILSADPRMVPDANSLPRLSYAEAFELAYFGASVIHPQTFTPIMSRGLPVHIRNTFDPDHPGTFISPDKIDAEELAEIPPVKGISAIDNLAVITLEGTGLIGVPGTAERTFQALRQADVSVIMISQGSSEHSICCVVESAQALNAKHALSHAFAGEIAEKAIHRVRIDKDISVVAAVGDGMIGTSGVAARVFSALAHSGINIRAIAQGASERNISVAIQSSDTTRALRSVHSAFWLSPQTLSIGVVGAGNVGKALLGQILAARDTLRHDNHLDLRVRAISTSRKMWLGEAGLAASGLDNMDQVADLDKLADHVKAEHLPHAVIIDCSASNEVADHYAQWLARGIHVITPNKHAGAGALERYKRIHKATDNGSRFRYEATVGAGLPVITTLRDLLDTGDKLLAVDGIFSGSLAWLFNQFDGSRPFSELVKEALKLGYTEPDPRDDLSGTDVARKLVILAREAGNYLELSDVTVESLVPESLAKLDKQNFIEQLGSIDANMAKRHSEAQAKGEVLRYVARLDEDGKARVGIASLSTEHTFAHLQLTDNVIQFTTERYHENPLVVQGPGAGPAVTAAGVFADLLRIASSRGTLL